MMGWFGYAKLPIEEWFLWQNNHAHNCANDYFCSLHENDFEMGNTFEQRIITDEKQKLPDFYYEIGTIYGIITSIGGIAVNGKAVIHINDTSYDIEVNNIQYDDLFRYYKKNRICFLLRKKISVETDEIVSAELESFVVSGEFTFSETMANSRPGLSDKFIDLLKGKFYTDK